MPASRPPRSRTPSISATWPPARRASASPSTWPRTAATIRDNPRVAGDVGMAGRRHRQHPRHADPLRRHPAGPDQRVDDDERRRAADPGALHHRRRGAGRAAGEAHRHDPERHPQGVHGPQHLHLSPLAEHADHRRHLQIHKPKHAAVQQHQHLRLPHAGGRRHRRSRARLHDGRRPRIPARPASRPA